MKNITERLREAKTVTFFDGWSSSVIAIEAADEIDRLRALVVEQKVKLWNFDGVEKIRADAFEEAIAAVKASAGGDFVMTGPAGVLSRAASSIRALIPTPATRKKPDWRDPFCKRRDENVLSNIRDAYFYGFEDALEIVGNTPTPAPRADP